MTWSASQPSAALGGPSVVIPTAVSRRLATRDWRDRRPGAAAGSHDSLRDVSSVRRLRPTARATLEGNPSCRPRR